MGDGWRLTDWVNVLVGGLLPSNWQFDGPAPLKTLLLTGSHSAGATLGRRGRVEYKWPIGRSVGRPLAWPLGRLLAWPVACLVDRFDRQTVMASQIPIRALRSFRPSWPRDNSLHDICPAAIFIDGFFRWQAKWQQQTHVLISKLRTRCFQYFRIHLCAYDQKSSHLSGKKSSSSPNKWR